MAATFVSLSCVNCGAKLQVYEDMERFACQHCGTEVRVERRGGTVALKNVLDAIQRVQAGTDRTAAELAIVRYEKELEIARARLEQMRAEHDRRTGIPAIVGALVIVFGVIGIFSNAVIGVSLITIGALALAHGWRREEPREVRKLEGEIVHLERKLAENKALVDS